MLYCSAKIEWKIKVCVMENKVSVAKMMEMKITEGIYMLLEHKSIDYLDHFKSYMWSKLYMFTCVCMLTYTCTYGQRHTYVQKHENFHMYAYEHICYCLCQQMHLDMCVYLNVDMCINIACVHSYALIWVSKALWYYICIDKYIHVYTHMFLCVYVTIFQCLSMCTYACTFWCTIPPADMCIIKMWANMHILIYLSEQKYHLTDILHAQLNSSKCFFQLTWKKN